MQQRLVHIISKKVSNLHVPKVEIFPRKYFSVFLENLLNTHKEENRYKMHLFQKKEQFGQNSYARKLLLSVQNTSKESYKLTLGFSDQLLWYCTLNFLINEYLWKEDFFICYMKNVKYGGRKIQKSY